MNCSTPGLPVHHQLPEFTQTHVHRVGDAIQPSHPLSSPSPPAPNPSQHRGPFQWVSCSHEVAKVLEFQLQHHSYSLSAIRVVSSAYLRLLIFLPAILIPACVSSSPVFLTMYSAYKLILEKCKSKPQWDITSHQSEWPSSESLQKRWRWYGETNILALLVGV